MEKVPTKARAKSQLSGKIPEWAWTVLRKLTFVSAKIGDRPILAIIEGQLEVTRNWVYVEDDGVSGVGSYEQEESVKRDVEGEGRGAKMEQDKQWDRAER